MGVSPCTRGATSGLPFWRRKPGPVPRPRRCTSACAPLSPPLKAVSQGSSDAQILDLSNRFYTLIPHDFGMKKPPLLNNADSVKVAGVQEGAAGPLAVVLAGGCRPRACPSTSRSLREGASAGRATVLPSFRNGVSAHVGGARARAEQAVSPHGPRLTGEPAAGPHLTPVRMRGKTGLSASAQPRGFCLPPARSSPSSAFPEILSSARYDTSVMHCPRPVGRPLLHCPCGPSPACVFSVPEWRVVFPRSRLSSVPPGQGGNAGQPAGHRGGLQLAQVWL